MDGLEAKYPVVFHVRRIKRYPGQLLLLGLCLRGPLVMAAPLDKDEPASICGDSRIVVVGQLPPRWHAPMASACASISAMADRDETARLSVSPLGDDLHVEVRLADGRMATRRVHAPSALTPTLEALLALPKAPPTTPAVDPANPPDLVSLASQTPSPSGLELGGGVGARVAGPGPYYSGSVSGFVQMRRGRWLFGAGVRWEPIEALHAVAPPRFESVAFAVALTAGRRFELGRTTVDIGLSPRLVTQTQTALLASGEESDSDSDIRTAVFSRASFGRGPVRFLLEADGELSPTRFGHTLRVLEGFPTLPTWSAGFSAGVQWGEL